LNCDMGEGMDNDELIMPFISSANIACGYHAGDESTIQKAISIAAMHNVAVGAHVSFLDKENFGRIEMNLPANEVYDLVTKQLIIIKKIADSLNIELRHIKPHGALYNMSAKDEALAKTIAQAAKDFDQTLVLFGLSCSHSINEAKKVGLKTANEAFADRTYQDDGSLTPRTEPDALIENTDKAIQQILQIIKDGTVTTVSGKQIPIAAETICIHGDGKHAIEFARSIYGALTGNKIAIRKT
ncbi:MAG TPA: 5-oxoprolinase subunit PxpA, partial [Chitinophagaceae bacterium]|nr:5-oxoprolinase subunit PxpA [Chitinophagaceae bacterium]